MAFRGRCVALAAWVPLEFAGYLRYRTLPLRTALQQDSASRPGLQSPETAWWLQAAEPLHAAARARDDSRRRQLLYAALGVAIDHLGDERIDTVAEREWERDLGYVEALMVLADIVHEAGALRLAGVMLDDLRAAAPDLTPVQRGRIMAQRARVEWKLGHHAEALERYRRIENLGKRARSPELIARATLGYATVAQVRGNLPDLHLHATRAAALADEHGFTSIGIAARLGLMFVASHYREHQVALVEGWRAYTSSRGNALDESQVLANLGQILLELGIYGPARACFAAVVKRATLARVILPALGGLALASAHTGLEPTAEWAAREIWRALELAVPRYELAAALLESGAALKVLHRDVEAARHVTAGQTIALAAGFHELAFRAEAMTSTAAARAPAFDESAAAVVLGLAQLETGQLPARVTFETAPA